MQIYTIKNYNELNFSNYTKPNFKAQMPKIIKRKRKTNLEVFEQPEVQKKVINLSKKFSSQFKTEEIREILLKRAPIVAKLSADELKNFIKTKAKLLGITQKNFINLIKKNIGLFSMKSETLKNNLTILSQNLNIPKKTLVKSITEHPSLIMQNPEKIIENVGTISKNLNIDKKDFVKIALIQSQLFYMKPETILKNIQQISSIFECTPEELSKLAIKRNPSLLSKKPESIEQKVDLLCNILKTNKEDIKKTIFRQPTLLSLSNEKLSENIENLKKLFKYDDKNFANLIKTQPILLYLNLDNFKEKLNKLSKEFNMTPDEITALGVPRMLSIVSNKVDNVIEKSYITDFYKKVQGLENNTLFSNTLTRTKEYLYSLSLRYLVATNDKTTISVTDSENNLKKYLLKNNDKKYKFEIPEHKMAEGFINYSKKFSKDLLGKQIFDIEIKKDS